MADKKKNKIQIFRLIVQLFFLVIVTIAAVRHQLLGGGPKGVPPIDGFCPFGGLEAIYKTIITGNFIEKLDWSNYALLGGTIILVILVGRYFCGWICALGTMQELFGKLGFFIFKKKFEIPAKLDKPMRYLKYGVLIWALYFTWKTGTLFIRPYDPFAAYAHIPAGWNELWGTFAVGFVVLVVSLVASMFYDRFFCKYACPLGAFLGIFSKISIFRIKRENNSCTHCNLCNKKCPVNIDISGKDEVKSAECIGCLECVTSCPTKKETLKTTILNKKIRPVIIAIIGVVIYLGVIGLANITGYWHTKKSLEEIAATGGQLNPDNIKGYMTIKDISETYKVEMERIYHKSGITMDKISPTIMIKEISGKMGIGDKEVYINKIKNVVREAYGLEIKEDAEEKHEESESSKLQNESINIEEKELHEKSEMIKDEEKHENNTEKVSNKKEESSLNPEDIKGFMTIREVADKYQINIEEIYKEVGITKEEVPETSQLRAIKEKKVGFEVETIRELVKRIRNK